MKMHTNIKAVKKEAKEEDGFVIFFFFKLAIILYFYIKTSQYIREVSHGQHITLCHSFVKKLPYLCRNN